MFRAIKEGFLTVRALLGMICAFFARWFLPVEYDDSEIAEDDGQGGFARPWWEEEQEKKEPGHAAPGEAGHEERAASIYDELPPAPDAGPWDGATHDEPLLHDDSGALPPSGPDDASGPSGDVS